MIRMSDQFSVAMAMILGPLSHSGLPSLPGPTTWRGLEKTNVVVRAYFEDLMKMVPHIFQPCKNKKHSKTELGCHDCRQHFNRLLVLVSTNWHRVIEDDPKLSKDLLVYGRKYLIRYLKYFKKQSKGAIDKDPLVIKFTTLLRDHDFQIASSGGKKPFFDPTDLVDPDDHTRTHGRSTIEHILSRDHFFHFVKNDLKAILKELISNPENFGVFSHTSHHLYPKMYKSKSRQRHVLPLIKPLWERLIEHCDCSLVGNKVVCMAKCPHLDGDCNECGKTFNMQQLFDELKLFISCLKDEFDKKHLKTITFKDHTKSLKNPKWDDLKAVLDSFNQVSVYIFESDYELEQLCIKAANTITDFLTPIWNKIAEKLVPQGHAYYCQNRCGYSGAIIKKPHHYYDRYGRTKPDYFITCPNCQEMTCMKCKTCHKPRDPCDFSVMEDTLDPETRATLRKITPCPRCGIRTEKSSGCDHMTCPCGAEYCYGCGEDWNKASGYRHLFSPLIFFKDGSRTNPYMCIPTFWRLLFMRLDFFRESIVEGFEEIDWKRTVNDQLYRSSDFLRQIESVLPFVIENKDSIDHEKVRAILDLVACNIGLETPFVPDESILSKVESLAKYPAKYCFRDPTIYTPGFYNQLVEYYQLLFEFREVVSITSDEDLPTQFFDGESILPRLKDLAEINRRIQQENPFSLRCLEIEIVEVH